MDKINLGTAILNRLGYIEDGVCKFKEGITMYSEELYGILFDLTEEMQRVVDGLRSNGYAVYSVISGNYKMSDGRIMRADTYLCLQ